MFRKGFCSFGGLYIINCRPSMTKHVIEGLSLKTFIPLKIKIIATTNVSTIISKVNNFPEPK